MNAINRFVLCATNFSSHAVAAADVAAKFASRKSEGLRLVHVATGVSRAVAVARRRLDAEAARLRAGGVVVEPRLLESAHPERALLELIRAEPPELVVVSSAGKGKVDRWVSGSFSEQIAEGSAVPTLVVRNPGVFDSWDWTRERLKVLLAVDLASGSDAVLRWAKQLRLTGPCDLVTVHVNWRLPTMEEAQPPAKGPVNPPAVQEQLERELRKKVRDHIGDEAGTVIVRAFFGDPAPCLFAIAREVGAPLVAVGAHQRHGLARLAHFSVSRQLLHQPGLNVMVVPVLAQFDPREAHIPEFRRVLVATDFSELGNAAVPFACGACGIGGLVRLVHVVPQRRGSRGRAGHEQARERLRSLVPFETGARCQPPQVEVLEGRDVAAALCAEAERFGADLVCLASHGRGASRALHGSVTKAVLKTIRRPLLVVRRPED